MDWQGSFGKPEEEQAREEEEAEQEEEQEEEGADLEKAPEISGRLLEEYFWKFWDLGDASEEGWPRARLVSIVSPSLSPTLTLQTPSLSWCSQTSVPTGSAPSSISSQKSTAPHAEPLPLRLPGPQGRAGPVTGCQCPNAVTTSRTPLPQSLLAKTLKSWLSGCD